MLEIAEALLTASSRDRSVVNIGEQISTSYQTKKSDSLLIFLLLLTFLLFHEFLKCLLVFAGSVLCKSFFDVKLLLSFAQFLDPLVIHGKFRIVHHSVV